MFNNRAVTALVLAAALSGSKALAARHPAFAICCTQSLAALTMSPEDRSFEKASEAIRLKRRVRIASRDICREMEECGASGPQKAPAFAGIAFGGGRPPVNRAVTNVRDDSPDFRYAELGVAARVR